MNTLEQESNGENPFHLLLDEWGTMGKTRFPNVKDLLKICIEVKEYTAASYISEKILGEGTVRISHFIK